MTDKFVFKSGSNSSKTKNKNTEYFETQVEQIIYIAENIIEVVLREKPDAIVLESLSLGSIGNATRTLAGLYFCILYQLFKIGYADKVHNVAPTSVKSWARKHLLESEQTALNKKNKLVKVKMEKSHMCRVAEILDSELLKGYTLASGKADISDAFLIAKCFEDKLIEEIK